MQTIIFPENLDNAYRNLEALKLFTNRAIPKLSTKEEELNDWVLGWHNLDREISDKIIRMLENTTEGLKISENILHHMEHTSIEEYKSMLAFYYWESQGKPVNDDKYRMNNDWVRSVGFISSYLSKISLDQCSESVKGYFRNACGPLRETIKRVKAYNLFKTFSRDDITNYNSASRFVDAFYREDLIIPALDGDKNCQDTIRKQLIPDNLNEHSEIHAMANMIEVNIFRIKDIVQNGSTQFSVPISLF